MPVRWPSLIGINWFPGHMAKGMKQALKRAQQCDCIIEVHDARVPITGRNKKLTFGKHKRILVLNKMDLSDSNWMKEFIKNEESIPIMWANSKRQHHPSIKAIFNQVLQMTATEQETKNSIKLMVVGMPNVGKSSFINALKWLNLKGGKPAPTGALPGVTRSVSFFIKISTDPLIKLYDTPGIMIPNIKDNETALKLAAIGTFKDHLVGETSIAEYILHALNKQNKHKYVEVYDLSGPCDEIDQLLDLISIRIKARLKGGHPDTLKSAIHFIKKFREGHLGRITLDYDKI